jgi:YHS domain-containing protein
MTYEIYGVLAQELLLGLWNKTSLPSVITEQAVGTHMNRIQQVYLTRRSGKAKHNPTSKWKALTQPAIRFGLVVFALGTFAVSNSNANGLPSAPKDLPHSAVQIWLTKGEHKVNLDSKGVILKGYDPVGYFVQKKAVKGNPKFQTTYQGATYYFASAADLAVFKKGPSKYVPQYGGFCANGMANRKASDIDPNVFFVLKGKLYVCASPEAEKQFHSNLQENLKKADQNWEEEDRWFY